MTDSTTYRPGTILAEMLIDIYASKKRSVVTILHDKPFDPPLQGLELDPAARHLDFVFPAGKRELGSPLREELIPYFKKSKMVTFFLVDPKSKMALSDMRIPVKIVDRGKPETGEKDLRGKFKRKSDD